MSDDKTVFISYRRSNSSFIARAVFQDLRANGYGVFMDVESIDAGAFSRIILNQIAARAHFVLLLAPGSVERCADVNDWLRREIEEALKLERNIVPLLFSSFSFREAAPYLTGELEQITALNALNVPHDYFDEAMVKLRNRFLKQLMFGVVHPTPTADLPEVQRKVIEAASEPAPTKKQLSAEEYFGLAVARSIEDYDGKIADFGKALQLNPQFEAYLNRGAAYYAKGDFDSAISDYGEAIRLNPQYALAYLNRGTAYYAKGDFDSAISDYREAVRLNPHPHNLPYWGLGNCYYDKKQFADALQNYQRYLDLAGKKPAVFVVKRVAELKKKLDK